MASIGQSITGPRFVETDEVSFQLTSGLSLLTSSQWFDRQKSRLEVLETQLRGLVKAIDLVSKQRNGQFAIYLIYMAYVHTRQNCRARWANLCRPSATLRHQILANPFPILSKRWLSSSVKCKRPSLRKHEPIKQRY
jgi:hypothetical protein